MTADRGAPAGVDVLVYVEDPGAASYAADLPAALAAGGVGALLLAGGSAAGYLRERGRPAEAVPEGESAEGLLDALRPRLVVVGTSEDPDTPGLALVDAARSRGIGTVGLVDAFPNAAHRFRGRGDDPLGHAPDWLAVPDEWTRQAFVELGAPPARVVVCGHPQYDRVRALAEELGREGRAAVRARVLPNAGDRPVIVFVAEVSTGLDPAQYRKSAEYTLQGRGWSTGRTEVVLEELLDAAAGLDPRPCFVLRLHPKNTAEELASYAEEVDMVSAGGSALELAYAADLVAGMTSMLLLEADLLGTPTLAVVPRPVERDWLPSIRHGRTPCVTTRERLRDALPRLLAGERTPGAYGGDPSGGSMDRVRRLVADRLRAAGA
ncbi:MAG TPA: hypothetical protein VHG51_05810 [Longimicrobiaceae bacterium]|nr:hypothetical protein [Longimicrobiaceae bacterium]